MGTQGTGRKRSTKKEKSTAEDDALNLIAREAEARLAAKRAARAEAREIRMKELERQQKEEDSERYSRSSRIQTLSDDDERVSVGSRGSVRSDLDAVGAYGGGDSIKKSKKKKKHKHKDRSGCDDDYSVVSSRSSRLSDESRASRSSRLDLTSSRLSDDTRVSRASRLDLQPASYASSDLYSFNGLSSSRNGYQSSLYEDGLGGGSQRVSGSSSRTLQYSSYRSSGSRASSRAGSARTSPVEHSGSVASFLRSSAGSGGLPQDLDDVTIPDFPHVEDRDYLEKGSRAASALTAATLTSVGGTSSRRGSGETAITIDAETSIREIKEIHELKDQIQDVESKYTQNLKEVKDALGEVEEKYRKAMVSNAQLDNEKNNLMYQVDTLKDSLMELEELLCESRRGYEDKVKEYEREKHSHALLQFQFTEMKETLKQSEELLNDIRQLRIKQEGFVREISDLQETVEWKDKKIGALERQKEYTDAIRIERDELREETVKLKDILKKHGIVLGPDLNINGELGEAEVAESPGVDPVTQPAADSQSTPTEGHSMLGNTEETPLRSSREEEAAPEQHRLMFDEVKLHHVSCDALCTAAGVSTLETSGEEPATCFEEIQDTDTGEQNVAKGALVEDLNVIDRSITEAKDRIICSPQLQEIVKSSEGNVPITKIPKGGDVREMEPEVQSVNSNCDDLRESCENLIKEQHNKPEDGGSDLQSTKSCPQQIVDVLTESLRDEGNQTVSNTEHQQEPEEAEEAENDEAEEMPGKCQPQGAAASGKKKKRKRRGKKKGTHEDKNQANEGSDPEKGKKEIHNKLGAKNNGPPAEPGLHGSASGSLGEPRVDKEPRDPNFTNESLTEAAVEPVTDEQDHQHEVETKPPATPEEEMMDNVTDKHSWGLNLETETVKDVEAVALAKPISPNKTLNDCRKDERDEEQTVEPDKVEELGARSVSPVPETNLSTSDLTVTAKGAESTDGSSTVIHGESHVVQSVEDQVGSVDAMQSDCATKNPKNAFETSCKDNEELHVLSNEDIAADPSEPTRHPESKEKASQSQSSPDVSADNSSGSTPPAAQNSCNADALVQVSCGGPEEAPNGGDSELKADRTKEEELDRRLIPEDLVEPDHSPTESGDCCDSASLTENPDGLDSVKSLVETVGAVQAELGHGSQDESAAKVSSETEKINTTDALQTSDSPRGATEICLSSEQDHQADPECGNQMSSNDPHSESPQSHEPSKDEPEDEDVSQPTLRDTDEEDEGHSFDFDDMDSAVATSLLGNPSLEEVEEGVEVMPDEGNDGSSTGADGADEPAEGPRDGGHRGDTGPSDNPNSREDASSQQAERMELVSEKQTEILEEADEHIPEEGEVCVVAEDIDQVASLPVEEGLDAAKHEDLPQRAQGDSSKEPQQAGKEMKRTSKRGKGKGKEDCKMS
ncbi:leucine-rich repeat flightless-interacting protein 1 isoform X3 [Pungitius pungitius]|uniref:leucine-rich repeat flightless-interacting protein 1 isoform X3 n=1 Tax=Pungitius pungitius TaxID=134920 RepID=UPI002E13E04E